MKNNNHKKSDADNRKNKKKSNFFKMLFNLFITKGNDTEVSSRRAAHHAYGGENPIFYPRKHTVMGYAKQNRLAKQKRKARV